MTICLPGRHEHQSAQGHLNPEDYAAWDYVSSSSEGHWDSVKGSESEDGGLGTPLGRKTRARRETLGVGTPLLKPSGSVWALDGESQHRSGCGTPTSLRMPAGGTGRQGRWLLAPRLAPFHPHDVLTSPYICGGCFGF